MNRGRRKGNYKNFRRYAGLPFTDTDGNASYTESHSPLKNNKEGQLD